MNKAYIRKHIDRLNSGKYDRDDCLWRIASNADLFGAIEQIDDSNRDRIEQWVEDFSKARADFESLLEPEDIEGLGDLVNATPEEIEAAIALL